MKENKLDSVSEAVKIARENGMTYKELQQKESLGLVKIKDGKLLIKGKDY